MRSLPKTPDIEFFVIFNSWNRTAISAVNSVVLVVVVRNHQLGLGVVVNQKAHEGVWWVDATLHLKPATLALPVSDDNLRSRVSPCKKSSWMSED